MLKKLLFAVFIFLVIIGIIIGCYSRTDSLTWNTLYSTDFTPSHPVNYEPRTSREQIKIFIETPSTPFIELGFLQGDFHSTIITPKWTIDRLKQLASDIGGDAIMNLSCNPGSGWGRGYCRGTAIRFTSNK